MSATTKARWLVGILASFGISLMTVFMGGLASPYYAGLSLVFVASDRYASIRKQIGLSVAAN